MKLYPLIFFICLLSVNAVIAQSDKSDLTKTSLLRTAKDTVANHTSKDSLLKSGKDTAINRHSKDSLLKKPVKDTTAPKTWHNHIPKYATRRSAIIPGWGQAYNHEYWKIPIVYGALSIPTITFIYNNTYYKLTKFAYEAVYAATYNNDSTKFKKIDSRVKETDGTVLSLDAYQSYRNSFRSDRDYSVFWFLIVWGLNVVDATVFAHLKDFDVSNDLTMHIEPSFNSATKGPGLSFVFNFKNTREKKPLPANPYLLY
jgi:hypothetical protein